MSLRSCMSPNIQAGPVYDLEMRVPWPKAGWCTFKTVSDDVLEVIGHLGIPDHTYDFDVRITTEPGFILTLFMEERGKPVQKVDTGATLNGCTLQAKYLLGGLSFGMKAYNATTTEIDAPGLIPNIYIVPQ